MITRTVIQNDQLETGEGLDEDTVNYFANMILLIGVREEQRGNSTALT